jgi:hypothetical protein
MVGVTDRPIEVGQLFSVVEDRLRDRLNKLFGGSFVKIHRAPP